jgi:hypothetical protein
VVDEHVEITVLFTHTRTHTHFGLHFPDSTQP